MHRFPASHSSAVLSSIALLFATVAAVPGTVGAQVAAVARPRSCFLSDAGLMSLAGEGRVA